MPPVPDQAFGRGQTGPGWGRRTPPNPPGKTARVDWGRVAHLGAASNARAAAACNGFFVAVTPSVSDRHNVFLPYSWRPHIPALEIRLEIPRVFKRIRSVYMQKADSVPRLRVFFPLVSLAEAREQAFANRKQARSGGDPLAEKRKDQGVPTFEEAAARVIEIHRPSWKNGGKSEAQWESSLRQYVFPRLGRRSVSDVTTADVMSVRAAYLNARSH